MPLRVVAGARASMRPRVMPTCGGAGDRVATGARRGVPMATREGARGTGWLPERARGCRWRHARVTARGGEVCVRARG
jgi:hypothetical protein